MSRPESPTLVFAVDGMHCASCGLLVDDFVEEVPGVASSSTHVPRGRTVDPAAVSCGHRRGGLSGPPLA